MENTFFYVHVILPNKKKYHTKYFFDKKILSPCLILNMIFGRIVNKNDDDFFVKSVDYILALCHVLYNRLGQ